MRTQILLCVAFASLLGCSEDGSSDPPLVGASAPLALTNGLMYAGSEGTDEGSVLTLDLAADRPRVVQHPLPEGTVVGPFRRNDAGDEAVLLTTGRDAYDTNGKHEPKVNSHVMVVSRAERVKDHVLKGGRYQGLAVSQDGRFAVAHAPLGSVVLQNAIEVVDLAPEPAVSTVVNLQLDGRAPSRFVFSPQAGFNRRIVVIPFTGAIVLLDLEHPERGEIAIPLSVPGDPRTLEPQDILFAGDRLFVQSSNSNQVLMIDLLAAPESLRDFRALPSLLTAAGNIVDIALSGTGEGLRLLALSSQLESFDPQRGISTSIAATTFNGVLPFEGSSPFDDMVGPQALLYAGGQTKLGFADLGSADAWENSTIEQVELGAPLSTITPLTTRKLAIALHSGSSQLSVIDLQERRVDPYRLDSPLRAFLVDEDAQHAWVWILTNAGKLDRIDLLARQVMEVPISFDRLDDARLPAGSSESGRLLLIPGTRRRIAINQQSSAGHVTLVDAEVPTRESALELVGFFLAGLFD
jgi:hypothetical protein